MPSSVQNGVAEATSSEREAPYVSVIAASRNDEHGGNLLGRTQIFVEAWINQAKRHNIQSELILVEWNPPRERERLAQALRWPVDTGPCQVRIIEVPPHIHSRYLHGDNLPLYQMIGKNAGIRRARGQFLLLTNIDIVLSDELCQYIAARRLEKGRMYRIDRTDVGEAVPVNGTLDQQLAYCRESVLRLYSREDVYPVTADGLRQIEPNDIVRSEGYVHLGAGWFSLENAQAPKPFRWIGDTAELLLQVPRGGGLLELEIEAGPGAGLDPGPKTLEVLDWNGAKVAAWSVSGRDTLQLIIPSAPENRVQTIRLRVPDGGTPLLQDHRILNFRIFRCELFALTAHRARAASGLATLLRSRSTLARLRAASGSFGKVRQALRLLGNRGGDIFEAGLESRLGRGWYSLEDPNLEKYRWASEDAQLWIRVGPKQSLAFLVEPGPSVGFQQFTIVVCTQTGRDLGRIHVSGVTYAELSFPFAPGDIVPLILHTEGGGPSAGQDPRILNFRVYAIGEGLQVADNPPEELGQWIARTDASAPAEIDWGLTLADSRKDIEQMGKPAFLHTYACGDFTMMARQHWFDVRGYIEFDGYSMHMDSMLCYAAHHSGALEEVLPAPMRAYHIEHGIGSGWSPEGQNHLFTRLSKKGISWVSNDDMADLISHMRLAHAPVIFNPPSWGLAGDELPEMDPVAHKNDPVAVRA